MDLYCTKCGEPWDMDSLHDLVEDGIVANWEEGRKKFAEIGCELWGCSHNENLKSDTAMASALMFEMLGDDVDGIAAMMEDFEMGYY